MARDAEGNFWLLGHIDDVMSVSGHRISTTEVESALIEDQRVAEAGRTPRACGAGVFAFCDFRATSEPELPKTRPV